MVLLWKMTRTLSTRSSSRRPVYSNQEYIPEEYKETSPTILSESIHKKSYNKPKLVGVSKENVLPRDIAPTRPLKPTLTSDAGLPQRKSVRHKNVLSHNHCETKKMANERKVLCDKTNYSSSENINGASCNVLRTIQNKEKSLRMSGTLKNEEPIILNKFTSKNHIIISKKTNSSQVSFQSPKSSQTKNEEPIILNKCTSKNHIPIYKNSNSSQSSFQSPKSSQAETKEGVYKFEVDENEEPNQKKKRKKRVYLKKRKIGPKALTINNIKYSSSESMVSLPERPVARKKATNSNIKLKSCSSTTNLNDTQSTSYSVKSVMSHPSTLSKRQNKHELKKKDLSVLHETQSEISQSPLHSMNTDLVGRSLISNHAHNVSHSMGTIFPNTSVPSSLHKVYSSSKHNKSNTNSATDLSLHDHVKSGSPNISKVSQDFLSSTPCKRSSLVVCNNSVFDDTYDLHHDLQPSNSSVRSSTGTSATVDNCFGFDQPAELEEPLLSPIKKPNRKESKKPVNLFSQQSETSSLEKPSIKEVIQMLKATVKKTSTETEEGDDDSPSPSSSTSSKKEMKLNFIKPPRRSYERRRVKYVHHQYESEEESEPEIEKEEFQVQSNVDTRPEEIKVNRCYKKCNLSKPSKSHKGTKGKLKIAKEEEEIERLAALMNAQFQKIDNVDLVVE